MLAFLLALAGEEEQEKVTQLYEQYKGEMKKIVLWRLQDAAGAEYDAEEIVQNTFVKIVHFFDCINFAKGEKSVRAYVFSILENEYYNYLKQKNRNYWDTSIEEAEETGEQIFTEEDFGRRLALEEIYTNAVEIIAKMEYRYRIPMLFRYTHGISVKTIAAVMDMSVPTVYKNLQAGTALLVKELKRRNLYHE